MNPRPSGSFWRTRLRGARAQSLTASGRDFHSYGTQISQPKLTLISLTVQFLRLQADVSFRLRTAQNRPLIRTEFVRRETVPVRIADCLRVRLKSAPSELTARSDRQKNLTSSRQQHRQPVGIVCVVGLSTKKTKSRDGSKELLLEKADTFAVRRESVRMVRQAPSPSLVGSCSSEDEGALAPSCRQSRAGWNGCLKGAVKGRSFLKNRSIHGHAFASVRRGNTC